MHNKHTTENLFENGLELLFLGVVFVSILFQIILGNGNILSALMRYYSIAGMMFLVGYYTAKKPDNSRLLFTKGLFYILLFLFFGLVHQVLIYKNNLYWSIVRLMTLLKLPEPSDIFFTIVVIFLVGSALNKKMHFTEFKKTLIIIICIILLAVVYIPESTFDYAILGVFLGTDNYRCIPLFPFAGFYFAGYFAYKESATFCWKHLLITFMMTVVSAMTYFTPLKSVGIITIMALPVYLTFLFVKYCKFYQKIVNFLSQIPMIFFDSRGKLRKTLPVYFTIYTLLFCILAILVFSPFWISGTSMIWDGDALSQYVPKAYYYMDYMHTLVKEFLNGNFTIPTYDFSIGFGGPITFNTEPFFLLQALFPASMAETAYTFISIFRLYVAGISVSILFFYFKRNHYEALFGTLVYVFSGFALHGVVIHAQFISPMILFPLLIVATEEIFQKKRWYLCTVFVAISLLSNYYFAYMNTLAMGIYFLTRFIFTKDKNKRTIKYFFSTTGLFAGSYLLGVLLGNLSLFTSFASYLGSGRTGGTEITTASLFSYGKRFPTKFLISLISPPGNTGYSSKFGFVPIVFIALIVLFLKNEKKILKFLFVLYTAFCMFPLAGFVFSGFSVVINRWGFMYSLLVSFITVCMLPKLRTLTKRELGILFLGIIPYIAIIIFDGEYAIESAPLGIIMLLVSFIVVLFINENLQVIDKKYANIALLVLCIVSIIVNAHLQYTIGDTSVPDNFVSKGDVLNEVRRTSLSAAEEIEDDSFYRVAATDVYTRNLNSSLTMDFNGINIFASTVDDSFVDFNREMANTTWSMILYQGFDNRTFLNTLSNVKYCTTDAEYNGFIPYGHKLASTHTINGLDYSVYENEYALPLGYTYSNTISEEELSAYSALEKQEILLTAASIENNNSLSQISADAVSLSGKEIALSDYKASDGIEFGDHEMTITKEDAKLTFYFQSLPNSETYIEYVGQGIPDGGARGNTLDFDICRNGTDSYRYTVRALENTYSTDQDSYVYNLGYHDEPLTSCTITFRTLGTFAYDSIKLYAQPMDSYPKQIEALKEDVLENVKISSNTVSGNISLKSDKLLVMGIPYQNGWTAYVDGKEAEIQKANYMFSGIFLAAGEHTIEFRYELPGIKLSLILTTAGIIIFITALIVRKKRKNKNKCR